MSDLRAAAQQALKSLRGYRREISCEQPCDAERALEAALEARDGGEVKWFANGSLMDNLRAALEQPEQEPVAWLDEEINCAYTPQELDGGSADGLLPLYTHPPRREWRGLTEEDIWTLAANCLDSVLGRLHFARAIEATLKERNA